MTESTIPLMKHLNDFLDHLEIEKGLSNKTQENYARFLKRFTDWLSEHNLTNLLPHQLTSEHVWQYRVFLSRQTTSQKTNEPLKKTTQNYYLIALRMFLNYFAEKDIVSLPSEKVKLAKQPKEHAVNFLNLDQVRALLNAPDTATLIGLRDRAILEALFSTGLRVSELTALDRDQIIIKGKSFLEITVIGKGNKPRVVYFSVRSLKWLGDYLNKRKDLDKALFVNYKQNAKQSMPRRLTARSVENIVKKYVKIAGLPLTTSPHTLRHSYATDLLSHGVDLRLIQEFLGHRNIVTTQIYTHVTNKELRDVYLKNHGGGDLKD